MSANSSPTNTPPPAAGAASWGWRPTAVSPRTVPAGREIRYRRSLPSAGARTGPPGPAGCRWRGEPPSGMRARSIPLPRSTRATPSGLRTATASVPVRLSNARPSRSPGRATMRPGGVPVTGGETAGSGTSVRAAAFPSSPSQAAIATPGPRRRPISPTGVSATWSGSPERVPSPHDASRRSAPTGMTAAPMPSTPRAR